MTTHKMQRSQWHHCPCNVFDSKFKSKSDLKHYTEGHDTIDSGKTFPCQQCIYIVKRLKGQLDHKKCIRNIDATVQGVMLFTINSRNCLITIKESHF